MWRERERERWRWRERGKQSVSETERELKQSIPIAKSAKCQGFFFCRLFFLAHFYAVLCTARVKEGRDGGGWGLLLCYSHGAQLPHTTNRATSLDARPTRTRISCDIPKLGHSADNTHNPPPPQGENPLGIWKKNEANVCLEVEKEEWGALVSCSDMWLALVKLTSCLKSNGI